MSKLVNIEFYLGRIKHNLESSKFLNFEENKSYAKKIHDFVDYFIKKRRVEIHPIKLGYLKKIREHLLSFIALCDKEKERNKVAAAFNLLIQEFNNYASSGSVYLLRHPEKSKEKGRALTAMGVKQAKHVAELIQEEILLSPKPVKIPIYTSELKRTEIFAQIIKHISKAEKIGKEDIEYSQKEDERLYQGPISKEAFNLVDRSDMVGSFKRWLKLEGGWAEEVQKGGFRHPVKARNNIVDFVKFAQSEIKNPGYYTIVLAISHSWILDTFLYHYTGIDEIMEAAEYAKIEFNDLYYKKRWVNL